MRPTDLVCAAVLAVACRPSAPADPPAAKAPEAAPVTPAASPPTKIADAEREYAPPAMPKCEDQREVASVSVAASFSSGGVAVREKLDDQEAAARACFEREFPLEKRNPGRYVVSITVANSDYAGGGGFGNTGFGGGGELYIRGTYPGMERCLEEAIRSQAAPPDVAQVTIVVHVLTRSERGVVGRGSGGGSSGYGSSRGCL